MAKLTDAMREQIIKGLAMFRTPTQVAADVSEQFGIEIGRQQVDGYNVTGYRAGMIAPKWHAIFKATREAYLADTASIGIANQVVRLERLQRMADKAESMGNIALASQLLEQAAKEMGNAYTNRRELTGKDGERLIPIAEQIWESRRRVQGSQ